MRDRQYQELENYFCNSDALCGLRSNFGDLQSKMARTSSDPYSDPMSDALLNQVAKHRATRTALIAMPKRQAIMLAEFFEPEAYHLQIRSGYYAEPFQLVGLAQYTNHAETEAPSHNISPKSYIIKVIANNLQKERDLIISQSRELLFQALNEFKEHRERK